MILTRLQSVSQSISPVFLSAELLWNRSTEFLKLCSWDIMCRFAYSQEILIHLFFLGVMPLLNLEIRPKLNILLKQFFSTTPLKLLSRILWNFVVDKYILSAWAYSQIKLICLLNDREVLQVDIFLTVNIQMLHKCDNYESVMCIRLLPIFDYDFLSDCQSLVWHSHLLCTALSNNVGL